jgi:uncharacterized protein (TIGR04255 family)
MTVTFGNAPLVEIIAELRWNPQPLGSQIGGGNNAPIAVMPVNTNSLDEFFMRFGGAVYKHGFERAERLIPTGFPFMVFQPVYRYRKPSEEDASVLYQVGAGVFSANAIPPYQSWNAFSPKVEAGIEALLRTRSDAEKVIPFSSISLRYLDAFGPALTQGRDVGTFIREVLNIKLDLPVGFSKHVAQGQRVKPSIQLALPLSSGMTMNVGIGEGMVNNEVTIIMDTTVGTTGDTPANKGSVIAALNAARYVIHEMFIDLTKPIEGLMQPRNEA